MIIYTPNENSITPTDRHHLLRPLYLNSFRVIFSLSPTAHIQPPLTNLFDSHGRLPLILSLSPQSLSLLLQFFLFSVGVSLLTATYPPSISSRDLSVLSPDEETLNRMPLGCVGLKGLTVNCIRLDADAVRRVLRPYLGELRLLRCSSFPPPASPDSPPAALFASPRRLHAAGSEPRQELGYRDRPRPLSRSLAASVLIARGVSLAVGSSDGSISNFRSLLPPPPQRFLLLHQNSAPHAKQHRRRRRRQTRTKNTMAGANQDHRFLFVPTSRQFRDAGLI